MSTYYRAQEQRCLALLGSQAGAQPTFLANRYFERAKELEQEVRFQSTPVLHYEETRTGYSKDPLSLTINRLDGQRVRHVCDLVGMDGRPCRQFSLLSHSVIARADQIAQCPLDLPPAQIIYFVDFLASEIRWRHFDPRHIRFRRDLSGRLLHD